MGAADASFLNLPAGVFDRLVEVAPVAMLVVDRRGRICFANAQCEKLFGHRRIDLVGRSVEALIPPDTSPNHAMLRESYFLAPSQRNMGQGMELAAQRCDGTMFPIEVGLTPFETGGNLFALAVIVDLTAQRRMEADLRASHLDLERRVRQRTQALEQADEERQALLTSLERQGAELDRLAREDPLTRLANRREFDRQLALEIERAAKKSSALSVAIIDIDDFKQVNDERGHGIGDNVLRHAGDLIVATSRRNDVVARYGGDEFTILMPGSNLQAAILHCERIRRGFQLHSWEPISHGLSVRISVGIGACAGGERPEDLLLAADQQLYLAKREGKNTVRPRLP